MKAIIGRKITMSQIFDDSGKAIPITLVMAQGNIVSQVKNLEKDGYNSTQVVLSEKRKMNHPLKNHLLKAKTQGKIIKEFNIAEAQLGSKLTLDQFSKGDKVSVTAISKGKGFSGTVKRHNFHTGPKTHGSNNYRQPGSIGSSYPQRVIKGRKMPGHLGCEQVTTKNLVVIDIDLDKETMLIKGAIPGSNGNIVYIKKND